MKKFVSVLLAGLLLIAVSGGTAYAYGTADFSDVPVGNWAYESIMKMADAGVIKGTGNGTFSPEEKVSAAMFLTLIGRVVYEDDVKAATTAEDNWYSAYVRTAQSKGLLDGTSISDARVEGEVTRYDMATVIYAATKLLGVQDAVADTSQITDYGDIPNKYTVVVGQVYAQGLIKGDNKGNFNGAGTMRRDEVAVVMARLVAITAEKSKETGGNGEIIVDGIVIPPPPDTKPILERPDVMPEPGEYTAEYQAYLDNCGEKIVTKTVKFKMLDITDSTRIVNTEMNIWREALGDEQHRMFVTTIKSDSKGEGSFTLDMPKSLYEKAMRDATGDLNSSPFIIFGSNAVWGSVIENGPAILNTSNVMEIADLMASEGDLAVDAILWVGGPGAQGFEAMGKILCGEVNPSGKTVDTWMTDLMSSPVMKNFGNVEYDNLMLVAGGFPTPVGEATEMNLVEYEENIYVGYRYYETVDDTGGSFTVFGQSGQDYAAAVQLPFGYGLSYDTDFTQTMTQLNESDDAITLTVRVTNNGTQAGKDVVQVYYNPPYTGYDMDNKIEKSTVNLIAFAKTGDIAPGSSVDVELSFDKEDMASYSYTRQNPDGTLGAYMLEEGDYAISINKTAHEEYESRTVSVPATIWYDSTNPRQSEIDAQSILDENGEPTGVPMKAEANPDAAFLAATNLFQNLSDHMRSTDQLTRANGPLMDTTTHPRADERTAPAGVGADDGTGMMTLQQMDLDTDPVLGNVEGSKVYTTDMPTTAADNGLSLASLRGLSYYDPLWDTLMDQLDLTDPNLYVALAASYDQTAAVESVSKPATVDFDGPQGIVGSINDDLEYTAYPTEVVIASTFNTDLAYNMGEAVGQEAIAANVNSWYAPAVNIHRSPFSGRNFEYYSEDPVLSGLMGAGVVSGCSDQGLVTTIKHFALNDQEMYDNDRSRVATWANEQAIREIYLKPFELAIKNARMELNYISDDQGTRSTKTMRGATGVMGCMNYWGFTWGGSSYALNTELLRDEWGFQGMVITDMMMNAGSNSVDQALRAGNDTWMAWGDAFTTLIEDNSSPTGVSVIRNAVKNMSYAIANSRAMDGLAPGALVTYKTSPWKIGLTAANIVVYGFIVAMAGYMVVRARDAKKNPEKYKQPKVKNTAQTLKP